MTDELTPEEKAAFDRLPRERMPHGLEPRVMEAMREHGFLARRRRSIVLTRGRVAGLVAAAVVMVIGAYSIGLERGQPDALVPPTIALQPAPGTVERVPQAPAENAAERYTASNESKKDRANEAAPEPTAGSAREPAREQEMRAEKREAAPAPAAKATAPPTAALESAAPATALRAEDAFRAPRQRLSFVLNGTAMTVEADSVRLFEDERGRMLLIYTPDGVIRLPLSGN